MRLARLCLFIQKIRFGRDVPEVDSAVEMDAFEEAADEVGIVLSRIALQLLILLFQFAAVPCVIQALILEHLEKFLFVCSITRESDLDRRHFVDVELHIDHM